MTETAPTGSRPVRCHRTVAVAPHRVAAVAPRRPSTSYASAVSAS